MIFKNSILSSYIKIVSYIYKPTLLQSIYNFAKIEIYEIAPGVEQFYIRLEAISYTLNYKYKLGYKVIKYCVNKFLHFNKVRGMIEMELWYHIDVSHVSCYNFHSI